MFETIATGFVADELPSDLTAKFLEAVRLSPSDVYFGISTAGNSNSFAPSNVQK